MRKVRVAVVMTSFILTWLSLGLAAGPAGDSVYYTRVGFYYDKGVHKTTNYLYGTWVPINTEVELLKKKRTYITIRIVGTGEEVKILNVKEYSGEKIDGIFERMFSKEATDLSAYSPEHVKNIKAGIFEPGMTKEEVILSIGYPPKHRTPSLDQNSWRYWRNRWNTVLLNFKEDILDNLVE